jgi:hypothetical protein
MAGRLRYRLFEPPWARASVPRLWVSLRARRPLWDRLAMVLTAVAVAIVGVVVLRGNSESLNRNEPFQRWDCRY